jgi:spore coat protein CotH
MNTRAAFARRSFSLGAGLVFFGSMIIGAAIVVAAAQSTEKKAGKPSAGADIFDSTNFVRIAVQIAEADIERLNGLSRSRLNGGPYQRPAATATVMEGNKIYTNVAIHLKGTSSFRPIGNKPALTLNFDRFVPGQRFHGLHQITLNNSAQDPTYVSEKVCRELFEEAGVPVPRVNYATLTLNGENQGLYVLAEAYNKQFLRRHFRDVSGNLYEGGVLTDISPRMDVNSGTAEDQSDLKELVGAVKDALQNKRLDELSRSLDLDRFISMIAMEIMLCHCDSYAMNRNNYRLFHDRDSGRMIFLPHGMDRTFGIGNRCPVDIPLLPPLKGVVARAVLRTTQGRERYLDRMSELNATLFDVEKIRRRVMTLVDQIKPVLAQVEPRSVRRHQFEVDRFLENIEARKRAVSRELDAYQHRLAFDTTGAAKLDNWAPAPESEAAHLQVSVANDGRKTLHTYASPGSAGLSWRAKAMLGPGQYRLEGKARTHQVSKDPGKGACLTVVGSPPAQMLTGDSNWQTLSCTFTVRQSPAVVEFGCELRANEGEAWFDLDSLILWRVE